MLTISGYGLSAHGSTISRDTENLNEHIRICDVTFCSRTAGLREPVSTYYLQHNGIAQGRGLGG